MQTNRSHGSIAFPILGPCTRASKRGKPRLIVIDKQHIYLAGKESCRSVAFPPKSSFTNKTRPPSGQIAQVLLPYFPSWYYFHTSLLGTTSILPLLVSISIYIPILLLLDIKNLFVFVAWPLSPLLEYRLPRIVPVVPCKKISILLSQPLAERPLSW